MRMLIPDHPVFNMPNKISSEDFEDWIQERGLYFSNNWDRKYDAVLSANDRGEPPRNGGMSFKLCSLAKATNAGVKFCRRYSMICGL